MKKNSLINIPNLITLLRFFLIPIFAYFVLEGKINLALLFFILIVLGDKADGLSARLMGQQTMFGGLFDAFTDWAFIISSSVLLFIKGYIPEDAVILFIMLVIVYAASKIFYVKKHMGALTSTIPAKLNAALAYIIIGALLLNYQYTRLLMVVFLFTLCLSILDYFVKGK